MWKVSALAEETYGVYTYHVDAPQNARTEDVASSAYAEHGSRYRDKQVTEWLSPLYTVRWEG